MLIKSTLKKLFLIILFLSLSSNIFAGGNRWSSKPLPGSQIDWSHSLSRGLVGCWLMNEGGGQRISDLTGNSNPFYVGFVGVTKPVWQNKTISFSGSGAEGIEFGDPPLTNSINITLISKFRVTLFQRSNARIVAKQRVSNASPYLNYGLYNPGTTPGTLSWFFSIGASFYETTTPITTNINYVGAGTFDGSIGKLYLNGIQKNTISASGNLNTTNSNLTFGIDKWNNNEAFTGLIEYVYIYNRALSPQEIKTLYQDPYCFIKSPTIWSMFSTAVAAARRFFIFD